MKNIATTKDMAWIAVFVIYMFGVNNVTNHILQERLSILSERITVAEKSRDLLWKALALDLNITTEVVSTQTFLLKNVKELKEY